MITTVKLDSKQRSGMYFPALAGLQSITGEPASNDKGSFQENVNQALGSCVISVLGV